MNPTISTLFLPHSESPLLLGGMVQELHEDLLSNLRNLAMDLCILEEDHLDTDGFHPLRRFSSLDLVTVVFAVGSFQLKGVVTFFSQYGVEQRTPPRLPAPLDARVALYLPEYLRFAGEPTHMLHDCFLGVEDGDNRIEDL
jgi:hypothetical protein